MGLAGRDPVFFAQLASETETFHPSAAPMIQDTCLGCHGIQGQRQFAIDRHAATGACETLDRGMVNAVPYPPSDPVSRAGALRRAGTRRRLLRDMPSAWWSARRKKTNIGTRRRTRACRSGRRRSIRASPALPRPSPEASSSGHPTSSTDSSRIPRRSPCMRRSAATRCMARTCRAPRCAARCHTVHLPVLHRGEKIGHVYEQTTYPEWAFSDYRTGTTPDGALPLGAGTQARSCQNCHMPNKDARGNPYRSKIAAIQEYTNFPQAEHTLDAKEIDLPERAGFAAHTLVGLNFFLPRMAWQFPDILGVRRADPMLSDLGSRPAAQFAAGDRRPSHQSHRRHHRRRGQGRGWRVERPGHGRQSGRAQVPLGRGVPPRLHRVQRARRQQPGHVGLGAHQRGRGDRRREGHADCRRAVVEARLLRAHRSRGAQPPAPLPGRSPGRIRPRSTRSCFRLRPTSQRPNVGWARSPRASSPPASCRSAPR